MASNIRLEKLRREFGSLVAVNDVTITFPEEAVTCLLGPSGCGKTTLMRMIAGLQEPTSGEIYFSDRRVTDLSPSERNIGMVFQYPVVYRGITLYENVALPLKKDRSLNRQQVRERVDEVLETLGLTPYRDIEVMALDNATKQKTAVARAVARQPQIILFDEPITNVDVTAKVQLKRALKSLVKQHSQTIVYVTHDQTEAMTLADEIALMDAGQIVQRGSPDDIYNNPSSRFGGWFLGNPGMNFIESDVRQGSPNYVFDPIFPKPLVADHLRGLSNVIIGIRPESVLVYADVQSDTVEGDVIRSALVVGGQHLLTIQAGDHTIKAKVPFDARYNDGDKVHIQLPLEKISVFGPDGQRIDTALSYGTMTAETLS